MNNEKTNNNEELETTEEVVEETVEEVAEETASKTVIERWQCTECESINETEECTVCGGKCELIEIEEIAEEGNENAVEGESSEPKIVLTARAKKGIAIGVAAVVCIVAVFAVLLLTGTINTYEKKLFAGKESEYIDISGKTLEDIADESGLTISEYKKMYDLPALMPKSTNENAVINSVPVSYYINQQNKSRELQRENAEAMKEYGLKYNPEEYKEYTIKDFREEIGVGKNITEKSTIGEALGEMKLSYYFGLNEQTEDEQNIEFVYYKTRYGLDEKVTLDTKFKEVRRTIDELKLRERIDPELAAENKARAEAAREAAEKKAKPEEPAPTQEAVVPENEVEMPEEEVPAEGEPTEEVPEDVPEEAAPVEG